MPAGKKSDKETPEPGILRCHGALVAAPSREQRYSEVHITGKVWNTSSKPILLRKIIVTVKGVDRQGLDLFATEQATRAVLSEGFELLAACAAKDIGLTNHRLAKMTGTSTPDLEWVKENTEAEIAVEWCSEGKDYSQDFQIPDAELT